MRIGIMLRALDEKGGVGVYTDNITRELLTLDRQNEYVLYYRSPEHVGRFGAYPNMMERVLEGGGKAVWDQIRIPLACRKDRIDVIFHPKFTVPLFASCKKAMVLHGAGWFIPEVRHFWGRLDRIYLSLLMPLYCQRADAILSISKLTTNIFRDRFSIPASKIHTVYFAPAKQFSRVTDEFTLRTVRERYGLPDRFIFTLSKFPGGDRKNIDGILKAFSLLSGRTEHNLVVAGGGCEEYRNIYGHLLNGDARNVHFPGYIAQEDLPAVYSLADLFLYPSKMESFPIPLTEAMTCGTPIVTSNAYGLSEIAGDAAVLVDADDPEAIAAAVSSVVDNAEVNASLSKKALLRSEQFSWEKCVRETLEILESIES